MDVIALARAGIAERGGAARHRRHRAPAPAPVAPRRRAAGLPGRRPGRPAAALRAAERALPVMPAGKALRFAILPEGEDPDSFVARHGGAAMAQVLAKGHSLSQLLWRLETQGRRFDTPEDQAGLRRRLRAFARLAADPDLRASLDASFHELIEAAFPRRARWRRGGPPAGPRARGPAQGWEGVGASRLAAGLQRCRRSTKARCWPPRCSTRSCWTATKSCWRRSSSPIPSSRNCATRYCCGSVTARHLTPDRWSNISSPTAWRAYASGFSRRLQGPDRCGVRRRLGRAPQSGERCSLAGSRFRRRSARRSRSPRACSRAGRPRWRQTAPVSIGC